MWHSWTLIKGEYNNQVTQGSKSLDDATQTRRPKTETEAPQNHPNTTKTSRTCRDSRWTPTETGRTQQLTGECTIPSNLEDSTKKASDSSRKTSLKKRKHVYIYNYRYIYIYICRTENNKSIERCSSSPNKVCFFSPVIK